MSRTRRVVIRAWPLLLALAVLAGLPFLLWTNRHGRLAVEASLYLPDMIVQPPSPFRPIELISDAPARERITIDYVSYPHAHGRTLRGSFQCDSMSISTTPVTANRRSSFMSSIWAAGSRC